jgi:multidrug efflux pump subunit AcrB
MHPGYSLDNLSLMALTLSVGFVVDDAIVMLETSTATSRWEVPREAAFRARARSGQFSR